MQNTLCYPNESALNNWASWVRAERRKVLQSKVSSMSNFQLIFDNVVNLEKVFLRKENNVRKVSKSETVYNYLITFPTFSLFSAPLEPIQFMDHVNKISEKRKLFWVIRERWEYSKFPTLRVCFLMMFFFEVGFTSSIMNGNARYRTHVADRKSLLFF